MFLLHKLLSLRFLTFKYIEKYLIFKRNETLCYNDKLYAFNDETLNNNSECFRREETIHANDAFDIADLISFIGFDYDNGGFYLISANPIVLVKLSQFECF